jgi:squalene-hopene/tetraprenyl-beta-curcumene cyclase
VWISRFTLVDHECIHMKSCINTSQRVLTVAWLLLALTAPARSSGRRASRSGCRHPAIRPHGRAGDARQRPAAAGDHGRRTVGRRIFARGGGAVSRYCGPVVAKVPFLHRLPHHVFVHMARPALRTLAPPPPEVRRFFEDVAGGRRDPMPGYSCHDIGSAIAIGVAASLALNDRLATGRLHPLTRQALDAMWKRQRDDGGWEWPFRDTPPLKVREHYAATLAAVAAGMAPDGYAETEPARRGLAALRGYLETHPAETLHEEAMLVWASSVVAELASDELRRQSLDRLVAAQRPDGGWSLASLVENSRAPATPTAEAAARLRAQPGYGTEFLVYAGRDAAYKSVLTSDGYATGLAIYVARQAGVSATDKRLRRGITWLKANQRASGRWFTPSQAWHKQNLIANAGTAYVVLALHACGEVASEQPVGKQGKD